MRVVTDILVFGVGLVLLGTLVYLLGLFLVAIGWGAALVVWSVIAQVLGRPIVFFCERMGCDMTALRKRIRKAEQPPAMGDLLDGWEPPGRVRYPANRP